VQRLTVRHAHRHAYALVFLACFALYACTLYPGVGGRAQWGDAAKWQYIGSILGVSHPPGSPLYVLSTFAWGKLLAPLVGSVGARVIVFSALCGAGAVAFVFATLRRLGAEIGAALIGAGTLAITRALWTFSTEAEVYAPLALAIAFVVHRFVLWRETKRLRDYAIGCAAYALAFGDHYLMLMLLPALLALVLWTDAREALRPRALAIVAAAILLGLVPFAWLWVQIPLASYSEFPGERSWRAFVDYLLVRQYRGGMFDGVRVARLLWAPRFALGQIGPGPEILTVLGIFALVRDRARRSLALFFVLAAIAPLVFLAGYREGDDLGGVLAALVPMAVLVGVGMQWLLDRLPWPRARDAAVALALAVGAYGATVNAKKLAVPDALNHLTWEVDGVKAYRWDLPCVLRSAEPRVTIVPPYDDYGARQIVMYYETADPDVRQKHITFRYMGEAPPSEWTWARQPTMPASSEARVVYAFQRGHADRLAGAGFTVEERTLDSLGGCGAGASERKYFRATPKPR
jgi:hypothetical protein